MRSRRHSGKSRTSGVRPFSRASLKNRSKRSASVTATMGRSNRSEEHTSELQSLMRISYAVFCLKQKKVKQHIPSSKRCNDRNQTRTISTRPPNKTHVYTQTHHTL